MTDNAWKKFDLSKIKKHHDYACKFQNGKIENWYGGDLLEASDSQGAVFIFQITEMKKLGKVSSEVRKQRKQEYDDFQTALKQAQKEIIERDIEIRNKTGISIYSLSKLSYDEVKKTLNKARKKFPEYADDFDTLEKCCKR